MYQLYYAGILVCEVCGNMFTTIDSILNFKEINMNEWCKTHGFEDWDYDYFKVVYLNNEIMIIQSEGVTVICSPT